MAGGSTSSEQEASGYPLPAFYFEVICGGDTAFQEVSGIAAELELESVVEGGENRFVHQLPKAMKYPKLVLKRGIAKSDSSLVKWCKSVLEQDYIEAIETRELEVRLLNDNREAVRSWTFTNAYPVNWEVEGFNATRSEVAIEKIELVYSSAVRSE